MTRTTRFALTAKLVAFITASVLLGQAHAQTLNVSAAVTQPDASCTFDSLTDIVFGTYESGQQADVTANGSLNFVCTTTGNLTIAMTGASATGNRTLDSSGTGGTLNYIINKPDSSGFWGDLTNAFVQPVIAAGLVTVSVPGVLGGSQNAPTAIDYSDDVTVSIVL